MWDTDEKILLSWAQGLGVRCRRWERKVLGDRTKHIVQRGGMEVDGEGCMGLGEGFGCAWRRRCIYYFLPRTLK